MSPQKFVTPAKTGARYFHYDLILLDSGFHRNGDQQGFSILSKTNSPPAIAEQTASLKSSQARRAIPEE